MSSESTPRASHPDVRLIAIHQLTRGLFEARGDIEQIFQSLACCLTTAFCDGCAIVFATGATARSPITCHCGDPADELLDGTGAVPERQLFTFDTAAEALQALPAYAAYVRRFGLRALAVVPMPSGTRLRGTVIVTRDGASEAFEHVDLAAIAACVEHAAFAAETALQLDLERGAVRRERAEVSRFQEEMLRIVGHDLRAPLGAILIGTEMLALDRTREAAAARIVSFANRMTRMVDQILDLTRLRLGGGIPLARSPMKLLPLLAAAIGELALAHPAIHFELVGTSSVCGRWDLDRLAQVLSCVLGNAVQYGRDDGLVQIGITDAEGVTRITIHNELRDGAIGPETLASLLERRDEHVGPGLGLGLQISNAIVRAHGGTIRIVSSASGTRVEIALPHEPGDEPVVLREPVLVS
jgi:signal transduction histidine kinase